MSALVTTCRRDGESYLAECLGSLNLHHITPFVYVDYDKKGPTHATFEGFNEYKKHLTCPFLIVQDDAVVEHTYSKNVLQRDLFRPSYIPANEYLYSVSKEFYSTFRSNYSFLSMFSYRDRKSLPMSDYYTIKNTPENICGSVATMWKHSLFEKFNLWYNCECPQIESITSATRMFFADINHEYTITRRNWFQHLGNVSAMKKPEGFCWKTIESVSSPYTIEDYIPMFNN